MKKILIILSLFVMVIFIANTNLVIASSDVDLSYTKIVLLNQDPDPAEPGHYVELRFKVEKFGNFKMEDMTFELDVDYPFSFDSSSKQIQNFGDMKGFSGEDGYYILYYKLKVDSNSLEDNYTVKLKESNGNGDLVISKEFDIRVNDDKPNLVFGTLTTQPIKLVSDTDEAELNVELQNIGEEGVQNVIISVEFPKGFSETYGYSGRSNLGTINEGESKTAQFYVDIDENVTEGIHKAKVIINYKEEGDDNSEYKTKILWLNIPLKNKPQFIIEKITTNPRIIKVGDKVELRMLIKNIGGDDAESTSIRVFKESSQPFDFDDKLDYIGKLKPSESGEGLLYFTVDSDANSKMYLLDVEIRTIDDNDVLTQNKVIKIEVVPNDKKMLSLTNIIILTIILVIGFSVYTFIKKKKKSLGKGKGKKNE